jgi:hypothetical protein
MVVTADIAPHTCDSCGRSPARSITVRRHVGLLILQQFFTMRVTACRSCGRTLVGRWTRQTLWQGWWGIISFFFNWFVLAANAVAWRKLGALSAPSVSGDLIVEAPRGFDAVEHGTKAPSRRRSWLKNLVIIAAALFVLAGVIGAIWDGTHHDHEEAHGLATASDSMTREITGSSFTSEGGGSVQITQATCAGDGEPSGGGYKHFRCDLAFASGLSDEVIVHVLDGGDLFFMSAQTE